MTARRNFLQNLSATLVTPAAAVAAPATAEAQAAVPIRWGVKLTEEISLFYTLVIPPFVERVALLTGGRWVGCARPSR